MQTTVVIVGVKRVGGSKRGYKGIKWKGYNKNKLKNK